jgi:hypothetical protein
MRDQRASAFRTGIDGVPIHFIHVRGKGPKPKPLILSHGWPWTYSRSAVKIVSMASPLDGLALG